MAARRATSARYGSTSAFLIAATASRTVTRATSIAVDRARQDAPLVSIAGSAPIARRSAASTTSASKETSDEMDPRSGTNARGTRLGGLGAGAPGYAARSPGHHRGPRAHQNGSGDGQEPACAGVAPAEPASFAGRSRHQRSRANQRGGCADAGERRRARDAGGV